MPIKFTKYLVIITLLCSGSLQAQDAFRSGDGWGAGWGMNADGVEPSWGGATWDYINSSGPTNRYFRFYTDYTGCYKEWGPPIDDLEMSSGISIYLTEGSSKAYFVQVSNTSWHYIFRTRYLTECSTPEAVYFEIQGDVRDISTVSQTPTTVYPGQDVDVSITLSGASNAGQGYYLRYSTDNFSSSSIIELSGSGTSFSATIPGSINSATADVEYYVFSSGAGLSISHTDADFFTFNLNNGGSNYSYTVTPYWETANSGPWEAASSWTANDVPPPGQRVQINNHTINTGSDVSVSSLVVNSGGSLELGTNNTFTLANDANLTIDGSLSGNSGSKLIAPEGGYLNGSGTVSVYDLEIGEVSGIGVKDFYLDSSIEITHDLLIRDNGELYPGGGQNVTLEMSGANGNIYVDGQIDCVPTELGVVLGERLALHIPTGAQIILRPSDSVLGDLKFGDITIDSGASLISDAAGVLEIELQFGTLTCDGTLNFGQTSPGNVNVTLRGTAGNNYAFSSNNSGQVLQFSNLLIGNNGLNDGGDLQLANGSESIEMRVSGNFSNFFKFTPKNATESIAVVMNGFSANQEIRGDIGQTFNNKMTFANLTIDNGGSDVYLTSSSTDTDPDNNVAFEISNSLNLSQGKLITIQSDVRHNLVLLEDASIVDSGAQSIESGHPCYIEGPIIRETGVGAGKTLNFPVGQGDDFRNLIFQSDVATSSVQIKVEHFSYSANFTGMTVQSPVINVSDARFWNVKASAPSNLSNSQFTLSYGDLITDGITSESDLRVVWAEQDASTDGDDTNDKWLAIGTSGGTSGSLTSGNFSFPSGVNQIDLTLGNVGVGVNPLPVTWLSISCKPFSNYNQINWSTATESNTSHFVLQGAASDFNFKDIGETNAQGWSTVRTDYTLLDSNPKLGTSYYRLKQVDLDGSYSYSEIVSAANTQHTLAYPNPFKTEINIESEKLLEGSTIELWSGMGVLLLTQRVTNQRMSILTADLPTGIYFIRVFCKSEAAETIKLVKN